MTDSRPLGMDNDPLAEPPLRIYFARCPECFKFTLCTEGMPGGPAICEHPSGDYLFTSIGHRRMSGYVPTSFGEFGRSGACSNTECEDGIDRHVNAPCQECSRLATPASGVSSSDETNSTETSPSDQEDFDARR